MSTEAADLGALLVAGLNPCMAVPKRMIAALSNLSPTAHGTSFRPQALRGVLPWRIGFGLNWINLTDAILLIVNRGIEGLGHGS